jgi:hypothetical protein
MKNFDSSERAAGFVVAWKDGKPVLRRVYAAGNDVRFADADSDPLRVEPYEGKDGAPTSRAAAKALINSMQFDGPCCPAFESRTPRDYVCSASARGHICSRLAGCTAPTRLRAPLPRPVAKADDIAATVRRLLRAAHVVGDPCLTERLTASGVYRLSLSHQYQPIIVQVQPGRVRLGIGGPWMPVSKRRATAAQRAALQTALVEGALEEERARDAAKTALRKAYGRNYWQCYLLRFAKSMRAQPRRKTLEAMIPRVDCELGFRYALCCAQGWHPEGAATELDDAVLEALRLVAP